MREVATHSGDAGALQEVGFERATQDHCAEDGDADKGSVISTTRVDERENCHADDRGQAKS